MGKEIYKKILALSIFSILAGSCFGQKLRLNGYGSYVFDGMYNIYYGNGQAFKGLINQGLQLGFGMEYLMKPNYGLELSYFRRNTTVSSEETAGFNKVNASMQLRYVLFGLNTYSKGSSSKLQPFAGISAGIAIQTASNTNNLTKDATNHSITKFAWGTRLGGLYWLAKRVGVKVQGQWLSALQIRNASVNFDVNRQNGVQAESDIANQFEIGAGFVIKLGSLKKETE